MKFFTATVSLGIAVLTTVSARPASHLEPRQDACPLNVLSCSREADDVDTCCVPKYGRVVLAQQWYRGLGPSDEFTLHGLWPDWCSGKWVAHCDEPREHGDVERRLRRYPKARAGFIEDMKMYWPSYKPNPEHPNFNKFWSNEWNKHGTCVTTLHPKCIEDYIEDQDLYNYFNKTLALRKEFDIYTALKKAGITPGREYDVKDMHAAIRGHFHVDAAIECKPHKPMEIQLHLHVKNKDTYVMTDSTYPGSCRGMVSYPTKS